MNPIDKDMQTKWVGLKAGISDLDESSQALDFKKEAKFCATPKTRICPW